MIDKKVGMYPDFNQMLGACRKEIKQEEFDLCLRSFPYLFEVIKNKGHIDDHIFEDLGFPMDEDPEGHRIRRESNINQESRHRAKNLTHEHQVELRAERENEMELEEARKKSLKISDLEQKLLENEGYEKRMIIKLLQDVPGPNSSLL